MKAFLFGVAISAGVMAMGVHAETPQAPGPAMGPILAPSQPQRVRQALPALDGSIQWEIGDWIDEEQATLELINRARKSPQAETGLLRDTADTDAQRAYAYFFVDFSVMSNHMATLPPVQPLAPNAVLRQAARGHSQWMLNNALQSHSDGVNLVDGRVQALGYNYTIVGENIFAYVHSPLHGYAGMEVDWGYPDETQVRKAPGMQNPPGHRINNHDGRFREIGVGVIFGTNTRVDSNVTNTVGPALYTMNFGDRPDSAPMVTGVAYFDLDGDGGYDPGEGIGGLRVDVTGSTYFGVTTHPGGYAVPSANGVHTVRFSGPGMAPREQAVTVAGGANVKVDLPLAYPYPEVTGPATIPVGVVTAFGATDVPGATGLLWTVSQRTAVTGAWNAESGLTGVEARTTPGYEVQEARYRANGTFSYRLTSPKPDDQTLRLLPHFMGGSNPVLSFKLRLGWATDGQSINAEISNDDGATWKVLWSRFGVTGQSDTGFSSINVPLAGYTQREFQIRFRYSATPGISYYNTTESGEGAHLDDIQIADAFILSDLGSGQVAVGAGIPLQPPTLGEYVIDVRPVVGARTFPRGPKKIVISVAAQPVFTLARPVIGPNGNLRLDFTLQSGGGTGFILERAVSPAGPWGADAGATLTANSATSFTFRTTPAGDVAFYRVRLP